MHLNIKKKEQPIYWILTLTDKTEELNPLQLNLFLAS